MLLIGQAHRPRRTATKPPSGPLLALPIAAQTIGDPIPEAKPTRPGMNFSYENGV